MSRLTRFKKVPTVKLPRSITTKIDKAKTLPDDDNDDDDFQEGKVLAPVKESLEKEKFTPDPSTDRKRQDQGSSASPLSSPSPGTCDKTSSVYFDDKLETDKKLEEKKNKNTKPSKNKIRDFCVPLEKPTKEVQAKAEDEVLATEDNDNDPSEKKVVCPFCWKRLGDKLTGTTHVKSCAKNLPTNQIFEALQLQEKQIKEWEELGIAYPGYVGGTAAKGRTGKVTTRAPRSRAKKKDPDLELAIALSESLHEEVVRRKDKENNLLIDNGLEGEVEFRIGAKANAESDVQNIMGKNCNKNPLPNVPRKRGGKKGNLLDLPLYKSSSSERRDVVAERLSKVLDENENERRDAKRTFNVREPVPVKALGGTSSRLASHTAQEPYLWRLSAEVDVNPDKLINQSFRDCSVKNKSDPLAQPECQPLNKNITSDEMYKVADKEEKAVSSSSSDNMLPTPSAIQLVPSTMISYNNVMKQQSGKKDVFLNTSILNSQSQAKTLHASSNNKRAARKCNGDKNEVKKVVQDIVNMIVTQKDTDLILYGREEKPVKCHKFMITARCPQMLKDLVVETAKGSSRDVIPLTFVSHNSVKALVWFLYSGELKLKEDEQELEDLRELGRKYSIDLPIPEKEKASDKKGTKPQPQSHPEKTSRTVLKPGEDLLNKVHEIAASSTSCNKIIESMNPRKTSRGEGNTAVNGGLSGDEDLFRDIVDENCVSNSVAASKYSSREGVTRASSSSPLGSDNSNEAEVKTSNEDANADHIFADDDHDGSRDIFDDAYEPKNEITEFTGLLSSTLIVPKQKSSLSHLSSQQNKLSDSERNYGFLDDEIFTQKDPHIILSPKAQTKRSRSSSPLPRCLFPSQGSFSTSQMVDYLEFKEHGPPSSPNIQQANKKHKLDPDSNTSHLGLDDSVIICDETIRNCSEDRQSARKSPKFPCSPISNEFLGSTDYNNFGVCALSGPRLCSSQPKEPNPNFKYHSFRNSTQVEAFSEPDGFENDFGDSCLANLPSIMLQNNSYPTPSPVSRRSMSKSQQLPDSPISPIVVIEAPIRKKGRGGKTAAIKLTQKPTRAAKGRSLSQGCSSPSSAVSAIRVPTSTVTPAVVDNRRGNYNTNVTPMLNYSTLDTPVLKRELKRYGLKPLPRTKAKVILKHIYVETHKE